MGEKGRVQQRRKPLFTFFLVEVSAVAERLAASLGALAEAEGFGLSSEITGSALRGGEFPEPCIDRRWRSARRRFASKTAGVHKSPTLPTASCSEGVIPRPGCGSQSFVGSSRIRTWGSSYSSSSHGRMDAAPAEASMAAWPPLQRR